MSLNIPNPRLYTSINIHGETQTWPAVSDVAHGSYVTDGHIGPNGTHETINADIAASGVPEDATDILGRAGWDGAELSSQDKTDLCRFADTNGHSFAYNIDRAYEAFWQARGDYSPTAPPKPPVEPPIVDQGSELYESGHEISAKLAKGTKGRRAVYAQETAWGGVNAAIAQASEDGVPTCEEELKLARQGLLDFFFVLSAAAQEGRDFIIGTELDQCQEASDRVWNTFHACRKKWAAAKETGWELVEGDPRDSIWKYSRLNRIAWTALNNLTVACGLYGLAGELNENGPRSPEYVDSFESWENQDPNRGPGGEGGIGIPGNELPSLGAAASKGNPKAKAK